MVRGPAQRTYDVGRGEDRWTVAMIAIEAGVCHSVIYKRIAYGVTGAGLLAPKLPRDVAMRAAQARIRDRRASAKRGLPA